MIKHYRTILAAVDFSTGAHSAFLEAQRLAKLHDAKLYVLHVVDAQAVAALADSHGGIYESQAEIAARGASAALGRWLHDAGAGADCDATVVVGVPLHEILEHARRWQADLIVAGVAGAGGIQAGAGSVAKRLARKAERQILLVAAQAPLKFKRIVAGLDFSGASHATAEHARMVAAKEGAEIEFIHVWQEPWLMMSYDAPVSDATTEFRDRYLIDLKQTLNEFVGEPVAGVTTKATLINGANHGKMIAEHAREVGADLIVVGNKGRTNLRYVLLGSTAERLLDHLPCSLLVVKAAAE